MPKFFDALSAAAMGMTRSRAAPNHPTNHDGDVTSNVPAIVQCDAATVAAAAVVEHRHPVSWIDDPPRPPAGGATATFDRAVTGPARDCAMPTDTHDFSAVRAVGAVVEAMCEQESLRRMRAEAASGAATCSPQTIDALRRIDRFKAPPRSVLVDAPVPSNEPLTVFHSISYPALSMADLACALGQNCGVDAHTLLAAFVLMGRANATAAAHAAATPSTSVADDEYLSPIRQHMFRRSGSFVSDAPVGVVPVPTAHMAHRMYVACVHVAVKASWDRAWRMRTYARYAGVGVGELVSAEATLLRMLDWRTVVTAYDVDSVVEFATAHASALNAMPMPPPWFADAPKPAEHLAGPALPTALLSFSCSPHSVGSDISAPLDAQTLRTGLGNPAIGLSQSAAPAGSDGDNASITDNASSAQLAATYVPADQSEPSPAATTRAGLPAFAPTAAPLDNAARAPPRESDQHFLPTTPAVTPGNATRHDVAQP